MSVPPPYTSSVPSIVVPSTSILLVVPACNLLEVSSRVYLIVVLCISGIYPSAGLALASVPVGEYRVTSWKSFATDARVRTGNEPGSC